MRVSTLQCQAVRIYRVTSLFGNVGVDNRDNSSVTLFDLLVHLLDTLLCEILRVEFEVLIQTSIVLV